VPGYPHPPSKNKPSPLTGARFNVPAAKKAARYKGTPTVPIPSNNIFEPATTQPITAEQGLPSYVKPGPAKAKKQVPHVTIHQDGKIEVHRATPTAPARPAGLNLPANVPGGPKAPDVDPAGVVARARPRVVTQAAPSTVEQQAQRLLDPAQKSILDAINARIQSQQDAINQYTRSYTDTVGKYAGDSRQSYGGAQAAQAAVDAAMAATREGQGAAGQAELASKLQQINSDPGTAARISGQFGADTRGAATAAAGRGASSLSNLIGQSAAAQEYGNKQPGLAGLYGLQATKQAQAQGTTDTASAVAQLAQQYPGLVQSLKQNQQQTRALDMNQAIAASQLLGSVPPWAAKTLGTQPGQPTLAATTASSNASTTQANADRNYQLRVQSLGLSEARLKRQLLKDMKDEQTQGKLRGLDAKTYAKTKAQALGGARTYHSTWTDDNGEHPPLSWQQYLTHGLGANIPMWVLIEEGKKVYSQDEIRKGLIPSG
jgi:hypothetical protein